MTQDALTDGDPAQKAFLRLAASRARLRTALLPTPAEVAENERNSPGLFRRARTLWRQWTRHSPILRKVFGFLKPDLVPQPWRAAASSLADETVPLVRRHPVPAVLVAAAAGALVMSFKPWRWSLIAGYVLPQLVPLRNQAVGWMLSQATGAPGQAVMATVLAWITSKRSAPSQQHPTPEPPFAAHQENGQSAAPATAASFAASPNL